MSICEEEYEFKSAIFNCHFPTYAIDFHLQVVFDTKKEINLEPQEIYSYSSYPRKFRCNPNSSSGMKHLFWNRYSIAENPYCQAIRIRHPRRRV